MIVVQPPERMVLMTRNLKRLGRSIGFVPTLGALHEGHLSLIRRARKENKIVVVSIFVNPIQFGPQEDFTRYPRSLARDRALLKKAGVDILYVPSVESMYPDGFATLISLSGLTETLCGPFRPGHFEGVATVVAKLLGSVQPDRLYLGEKDFQQVRVIERMVEDLNMSVQVIRCVTVREADGLAMSSRNAYLSKPDRERAVVLHQALYLAKELIEAKVMKSPEQLKKRVMQVFKKVSGLKVQYFEAVDPKTLQPLRVLNAPALVAGAVVLGKTRLIDNIFVGG